MNDATDVDLGRLAQNAQDAQDATRAEQQAEYDDLRRVLSSESGRRLVRRILTRSGMFQTSFAPGDPYATAFHEGARNVGLRLLAAITDGCPEFLQQVLAK